MADITQRLKTASIGREEWRVQDPQDGSYCAAFSWNDGYSLDPEREARSWLASTQQHCPDSTHAGYVVACVKVQTSPQKLMGEAADEIERLRGERKVLLGLMDEMWELLNQSLLETEFETADEERMLSDLLTKAGAAMKTCREQQAARTVCAYPECQCPTESPCLQGLPQPATPALQCSHGDHNQCALMWCQGHRKCAKLNLQSTGTTS